MAVERLDHPDGEQWIERELSPSGGQMAQMERESLTLMRKDDVAPSIGRVYIVIAGLVKKWHVKNGDGEWVDSLERKGFDAIPAVTLMWINDDLQTIVGLIEPDKFVSQIHAGMRAVLQTVPMKPDDKAELAKLADQFGELMGVGGPNRGSQAA